MKPSLHYLFEQFLECYIVTSLFISLCNSQRVERLVDLLLLETEEQDEQERYKIQFLASKILTNEKYPAMKNLLVKKKNIYRIFRFFFKSQLPAVVTVTNLRKVCQNMMDLSVPAV